MIELPKWPALDKFSSSKSHKSNQRDVKKLVAYLNENKTLHGVRELGFYVDGGTFGEFLNDSVIVFVTTFWCDQLKKLILNGVKQNAEWTGGCIASCRNLKVIVWRNAGLTSVPSNLFSRSALPSIETFLKLDGSEFKGNHKLEELVLSGSTLQCDRSQYASFTNMHKENKQSVMFYNVPKSLERVNLSGTTLKVGYPFDQEPNLYHIPEDAVVKFIKNRRKTLKYVRADLRKITINTLQQFLQAENISIKIVN